MGDDSSGLFGAARKFAGAVLNMLFSAGTTQNTIVKMWTDDSAATADSAPSPALGGMQPLMQQRAHDDVSTLRAIDPDFNELQFLVQATGLYQTYLAAEAAMSADPLSSIGTSDFLDCFRRRVANWNDAGMRRVVRDVKMLGSVLMRVSVDGVQQLIVVRFSSSGVRYTQDVDTTAATEGSAQPDTFTEFGTFVRPSGTTTPKSAATGGATHCPSCGAPTTAGAAKCPFCGTQLTGTGANWMLDKISASAYT